MAGKCRSVEYFSFLEGAGDNIYLKFIGSDILNQPLRESDVFLASEIFFCPEPVVQIGSLFSFFSTLVIK